MESDLDQLETITGGLIFLHTEGSWSDGLDDSSIASIFGINGDAGGDRSVDLTEFYYKQTLLDDKLTVRIGKLDIAGGFKCRCCPTSLTNRGPSDTIPSVPQRRAERPLNARRSEAMTHAVFRVMPMAVAKITQKTTAPAAMPKTGQPPQRAIRGMAAPVQSPPPMNGSCRICL